jgi:putative membrane protein
MSALDQAAEKRIEAAVTAAESLTSGELAVLVVASSDDYYEVRALYAGSLGLCAAALAHVIEPTWSVTWLLWLQLATIASVWWLLAIPSLLRALLPHARAERAAQARARAAFLDHEVFATRDRSGVLILISELEHRIVILADSGIHARLPEGVWQDHVARIAGGFRSGKPADALLEVIAELGRVLAEHFPRAAGDENELHDALRRET